MLTLRRSRLPDSADWIIPGQVAAMAAPSPDDLVLLHKAGFSLIVNLTERESPTRMAAAAGLEGLHIPVEDMMAPTPEQVDEFVAAVERELETGRPVAVHCRAGVGRTGTMIACYLVKTGMAPWDAIEEVRSARPGSLQTADQESAVVQYARRLRRQG